MKTKVKSSDVLSLDNLVRATKIYLEVANPSRISLNGKVKYNPEIMAKRLLSNLALKGAVTKIYIDYNLPSEAKLTGTYIWISRPSSFNSEYLLRAEMDQDKSTNFGIPRGPRHLLCVSMSVETREEKEAQPIAWKITRKWMDEDLPTWYAYEM